MTVRAKPQEPWRQRLVRSLLYGRHVDRTEKARARVGLAMLAFAAIYAVIGGRLVLLATATARTAARARMRLQPRGPIFSTETAKS
jgi:cell division protein FtsI (penicillin-binding protein 3)